MSVDHLQRLTEVGMSIWVRNDHVANCWCHSVPMNNGWVFGLVWLEFNVSEVAKLVVTWCLIIMFTASVDHDSEYKKLSFIMTEFSILVFMLIKDKDEFWFRIRDDVKVISAIHVTCPCSWIVWWLCYWFILIEVIRFAILVVCWHFFIWFLTELLK